VAVHEIGHLLGFISGVDNLDGNGNAPGLNDNQLKFVSAIDLYRFSSRSIGTGGGVGVIDWTADNTVKYLSEDGGLTPLVTFSNGDNFGDGVGASHWEDNLGIGIMDPTVASGEFLSIMANDLAAFDMIGYNLTPTPEPSNCILLGAAGLAGFALVRRYRYDRFQKIIA